MKAYQIFSYLLRMLQKSMERFENVQYAHKYDRKLGVYKVHVINLLSPTMI